MGRVLLVVEGQTERAGFQQADVAMQFYLAGFSVHPKVVGKPGHKGGVRAFEKVLSEIVALLKQEPQSKISTFFDFYALPLETWPGYPQSTALPPAQAVAQIEAGMTAAVNAALPNLMPGRFVPYIQLFEFEALLFSDPARMALAFGNPALEATFAAIVAQCGGCETINNNPETAPSKRIKEHFPGYVKGSSATAHAPIIMGQIAQTNWQQLLRSLPKTAVYVAQSTCLKMWNLEASFPLWRDYAGTSSTAMCCGRLSSPLSAITSRLFGHSGQLCVQQTMRSQPCGSCPCNLKFRLSYSNSIRTRSHRSGPTNRFASQSGNPGFIDSTKNPILSAMAPKRKITPFSLIGACCITAISSRAPKTGRLIAPCLRSFRETHRLLWFR